MVPEPHICCRCKKEIVWTDYIPAICYACKWKEKKESDKEVVSPDFILSVEDGTEV